MVKLRVLNFIMVPFLFNVLISRQNQVYVENEEGIQFNQPIDFYFFRDDLVDADVVPEVGDIVLYQERYYGVQSTISNQYWGGKNPDYPNNVNPPQSWIGKIW